MKNKLKYAIGLALIYLILFTSAVKAGVADTNRIIHAVVMEASGESYVAQVGICAVIRNRGNSLQGIYGDKARRYETQAVYAQVRKAWVESATNDVTHGCKFFGGKIDDAYFRDNLHKKPFLTIGNTRFYK
jgi:hypothetical protein